MGLDVYNQQAATTEDPYMLILKLYEPQDQQNETSTPKNPTTPTQ